MLKSSVLTLNTTVKQRIGNLVTDMDGEIVIMSIQNSKYYNLGETGSFIWAFIKKPNTIITIIEQLNSEYIVDKTVCEEQTLLFLESLYNEGLIEIEEVDNL